MTVFLASDLLLLPDDRIVAALDTLCASIATFLFAPVSAVDQLRVATATLMFSMLDVLSSKNRVVYYRTRVNRMLQGHIDGTKQITTPTFQCCNLNFSTALWHFLVKTHSRGRCAETSDLPCVHHTPGPWKLVRKSYSFRAFSCTW